MPDLFQLIPARVRTVGRRSLNRMGFDLNRNPFTHRLVALMRDRGINTLLDVGANEGQYALGLRAAGYNGTIISVEPLRAAYERLSRHAAADPRWQCVHAAASDHAGTIKINVARNSVSSSVLPMLATHTTADPLSVYVGQEEVRAVTVDSLIDDQGLDAAKTMVKIDVQGFESTVLDGAADHLNRLAAVQLELSLVPLYDSQALMPQLVERMSQHGFELWLLEPGFSAPDSGRLLQCDGVFVRRPG